MAEPDDPQEKSLPVIAKSLAYLCMRAAEQNGRFETMLDRIDFLEGLGLTGADAAKAAGSTQASVNELRRRFRNKKARKNVTAKKKRRH